MKRYLLFGGDSYYPGGGWDDFINDFDTIVEAREEAKQKLHKNQWWQIIDTTTKEEI